MTARMRDRASACYCSATTTRTTTRTVTWWSQVRSYCADGHELLAQVAFRACANVLTLARPLDGCRRCSRTRRAGR